MVLLARLKPRPSRPADSRKPAAYQRCRRQRTLTQSGSTAESPAPSTAAHLLHTQDNVCCALSDQTPYIQTVSVRCDSRATLACQDDSGWRQKNERSEAESGVGSVVAFHCD